MNKYTLLLLIPCVVFVLTQAMGGYQGAYGGGYQGAYGAGGYGAGAYPHTGFYQQYALQSQEGSKQSDFLNMLFFFAVFAFATNFSGILSG